MSSRTDVLARQAAEERSQLVASFNAVERDFGALADWRTYVRREPLVTLGIAALGGAILGVATAPRRRSAPPATRSRFVKSGEAVVAAAESSPLLRRAGGLLLELMVSRALAAYTSEGRRSPSSSPTPTPRKVQRDEPVEQQG